MKTFNVWMSGDFQNTSDDELVAMVESAIIDYFEDYNIENLQVTLKNQQQEEVIRFLDPTLKELVNAGKISLYAAYEVGHRIPIEKQAQLADYLVKNYSPEKSNRNLVDFLKGYHTGCNT